MGDECNEQEESSGDTDRTEISIQKEISKLEYYLESADELIQANDIEEIKTTVRQASKITSKLSELIAQLEEIKIENGISPRTAREWKKRNEGQICRIIVTKGKTN